jgi:hypothetical protein
MRSRRSNTWLGSRAPAQFVWLAALCLSLMHVGSCSRDQTEPAATIAPAATPKAEPRMSREELDQLRALGYVSVVEEHDGTQTLGVLHRAPGEQEGLIYLTNAFGCSSLLMRPDGEVVHRWNHEPCYRWGNTVLLPNGDVVAVHRIPANLKAQDEVFDSFHLIRLSWEGELLWKHRLPVHHDVDVLEDGRIATLTYRHEIIQDINADIPVRNHYISMLDANGNLVEEASLTDLLRSDPAVFSLQEIRPSDREGFTEVDLVHSNAIEWMNSEELASRDPIYAATNVLVTFRHQDTVAIFNWETRKIVWAWGQGEISGPHDGTLLANGNVLIFDNGLNRKWSRVIEVNPLSREIVWEYHAPDRESFYTGTRGAAQRLPNGNTLITHSKTGRVFEVTREGEIVWDFRNPTTDTLARPSVVVRARRLPGTTAATRSFPRTDTSGG